MSEHQRLLNHGVMEEVSFVSSLFFQWINGVFKTGSARALDENDLLPLAEENSTSYVIDQLQAKWNEEKSKCSDSGKKPKLWKSVIKMLSLRDIIFFICTTTLGCISNLLEPLLLGRVVASLISAEPQNNQQNSYILYSCALAMGINAVIGRLSMHQSSYRSELFSIKISSALRGLVYRYMLLLSKDSLLEFSTGHVIDLVSNDVHRLEGESVKMFFLGLFAILEIMMTIPLLVYFIGWQTLMGVIFLAFLVPLLALLSSAGAALRLRTASFSDRRISLMNQVIFGIRAIKINTWEDEYREKIKTTRRQEIISIRLKSAVLSGVAALQYTSAPMAVLVSVITIVLTGQPLTPVNVSMLLSFINLLRISISVHLAYGFVIAYEAYVSLARLEEFLCLENILSIGPDIRTNVPSSYSANPADYRKEMRDVSVLDNANDLHKPTALTVLGLTREQIKREDKFMLQDIEFTAAPESLTVITGPVGSGKTTLLSAIAGEVTYTSGAISCKGTLVYVPQIPWVFSGTIRENILFGEPYDEPKYNRIIEACALTEDIKNIPGCDQTVVGERGEVLSGGQRARVSLARAVYADADLYLFDDPLSAVDFKVGQHIFKKCIKDLLGHKIRVLTSHQEQHMKEASNVIMMDKGRVLGSGKFTKLKDEGFFNTIVTQPLYNKMIKNNSDDSFVSDAGEKHENAEGIEGIEQPTDEPKGLKISKEDRVIGVVSAKLYWNYFRSGVPFLVVMAVICLCVITQVILVSTDVWLSFVAMWQPEDQQDKKSLSIYGCLVGASFIFAAIRLYCFLWVSLRCSERLHDKMVLAILEAPVLFFDSNPIGRILNRFSKDISCLDEELPNTFLMSIQMILLLFTSILVPTVTNPWLLFVVVPVATLVVYISRYYLKTSRELKRLESICRSPVFSHFSETLNGLETIRTRGKENNFVDRFCSYQDIHTRSFIMVMASGRWLGVRLDLLASMLTCAVALAAVLVSQEAASAGLALVYVVQTVTLTQIAVRFSSDVENLMTSVERVMTYTKIDSEPGYKVERLPPEHWPNEGNIALQDVSLTYYPGGPQVLKKINLNIRGGEKIGVAGRTGAGKSSFVAALMRMPDPDGDIMIDNVQVTKINLRDARRCISVLDQSPVIFSGSLRKNLDLNEQFKDADLWRALEYVQLKDLVKSLKGQLDHELLEYGANLSVGERQLICLARVLLQQNKIVILDEPTAHVDPETEQTIWKAVREKLRDSTVIIIAHRLNTIKDCEKILVLKNGKIDEFLDFGIYLNKLQRKH